MDWVRYGVLPNGSKTVYVYDEVDRVTEIRHESLGGTVYYSVVYAWNLNNTVASRIETDNVAGLVATTAFTYDARDRLIREQREQNVGGTGVSPVYDIAYTYDQLGNRLAKVDSANPSLVRRTDYFYDTDPANREPDFPTLNNRLMRYEERVGGDLVRTVRYIYYKDGTASNLIIKDNYVNGTLTPGESTDYSWYRGLAFYYFTNGSLRLAISDQWQVGTEGEFLNHSAVSAREFRYDSSRGRYMAADYNCNGSAYPDSGLWTLAGDPQWTDYAGGAGGVTPEGDFSLAMASGGGGGATFALSQNTRYFGFAGQQTLDAGGGVTDARYLHGDLIESNVMASNPSGSPLTTTAYTAFGERVGTSPPGDPSTLGTRYQYAGAYGYEAGMITRTGANPTLAPVSLSHVGARWYQPEIGRFVQRDPIGLRGGLNSYVYCFAGPIAYADASGLRTDRRGPNREGLGQGIRDLGGAISGVGGATVLAGWTLPLPPQAKGGVIVAGGIISATGAVVAGCGICVSYLEPPPDGDLGGTIGPRGPGLFGPGVGGFRHRRDDHNFPEDRVIDFGYHPPKDQPVSCGCGGGRHGE